MKILNWNPGDTRNETPVVTCTSIYQHKIGFYQKATHLNNTECHIMTTVWKENLIHQKEISEKPYFKRYRIKNLEIRRTFFNRRNSAEVFGESKACWELLGWNIDGLYILTTREHNYFVNILFLYMLCQFLLTMTSFRPLFAASKLKPRMWMSRNPACDLVHGEIVDQSLFIF